MCQLAAYVGDRPIAPLLLRALELQEPYFGAHATGIGVIDDGALVVEKDYGHVARVRKTTAIESLGGTTGYAINPARDLGPRIMHALLPMNHKGTSDWRYSWIPVAGPLAGASIAAALYLLHQIFF